MKMNVLKFRSKLFIPVIVFGFFITACASQDTNPATTVGVDGTAHTGSTEAAVHEETHGEKVDTATTPVMEKVDTAKTHEMKKVDTMHKTAMDTLSKTAAK
ncbi:MAG: hypothetical protein ABJB11_05410 [Ferruginibacter sp.]